MEIKPGIYQLNGKYLFLTGIRRETGILAENYGGVHEILTDEQFKAARLVYSGTEHYVEGFDDPKIWSQELRKTADWLAQKVRYLYLAERPPSLVPSSSLRIHHKITSQEPSGPQKRDGGLIDLHKKQVQSSSLPSVSGVNPVDVAEGAWFGDD